VPLAGSVAARGEPNVVGVLVAGTLGSVAGALPWYGVGVILAQVRLKKMAETTGDG